jgi:DNA-binding NarL/FixJ family response regulator
MQLTNAARKPDDDELVEVSATDVVKGTIPGRGQDHRRVAYLISEGVWLTPKQLEITRLLALGKRHSEISVELLIPSTKTIDTHRAHIMAKTGCRNNVELALWALRRGLVDL